MKKAIATAAGLVMLISSTSAIASSALAGIIPSPLAGPLGAVFASWTLSSITNACNRSIRLPKQDRHGVPCAVCLGNTFPIPVQPRHTTYQTGRKHIRDRSEAATWFRIADNAVQERKLPMSTLRNLRAKRKVKRKKSQRWQVDPIKRRLVEDHVQALLERRFRHKGWTVADTRRGNPFDAVATKGKKTRYLAAKGTERDGASILVTPREVRYARAHLGECVIGIVAGIRFQPDGALDPSSGTLVTHNWDPDGGVLKPAGYTWAPRPGA
jgi:hypothetical protein